MLQILHDRIYMYVFMYFSTSTRFPMVVVLRVHVKPCRMSIITSMYRLYIPQSLDILDILGALFAPM